MTSAIELEVNGRRVRVLVSADTLLLDLLREHLGLTSVRDGCGVGACGACTVLVSGKSVSSCLAIALAYDGAHVQTIEGLAPEDAVVEAFVHTGAFQCGYCTPGFVLMTHELLAETAEMDANEGGHLGALTEQTALDPERIAEHLAGNLCRCGTYEEIGAAVLAAAAATEARRAGALIKAPARRDQGRSAPA